LLECGRQTGWTEIKGGKLKNGQGMAWKGIRYDMTGGEGVLSDNVCYL